MLEPKFIPYLTNKTKKTKNGYEYTVLKVNTPDKLKKEYMEMVKKQDKRIKDNIPKMMI